MRRFSWIGLLIVAALSLTGCYTHNFPLDTHFVRTVYRPPTLNLFVDKDGTFFPDGWRDCVAAGKRWRERSLLGMVDRPAPPDLPKCGGTVFADRLAAERKRRLDDVSDLLKDADRVFIFIHGFNNSQAEADESYAILERGIVFRPGDALIRFYWDGYVAKGGLNPSPLGFWFKAVKNSQLAGLYGLRPVLAAIGPGRQVVAVTHSRGASVLLSALSNPPFASGFVKDWRGPSLNPAEISSKRMPSIHAIMLAPAIGHLDFCRQDKLGEDTNVTCSGPSDGIGELRDLPGLTSLRFTTNPDDPILRKVNPAWSSKLYPTTLGYNGGNLRQLQRKYPGVLTDYPVSMPHGHGFPCYATDPVVATMMKDARLAWRQPNVPTVAQRGACVKKPAR